MSNEVQLGGGSYSASELIAAIAQSNDPSVDLSAVIAKLDAIESRLVSLELKLLTLPTSWSIH